MVFGIGVKNIQAAAYNGARTVSKLSLQILQNIKNEKNKSRHNDFAPCWPGQGPYPGQLKAKVIFTITLKIRIIYISTFEVPVATKVQMATKVSMATKVPMATKLSIATKIPMATNGNKKFKLNKKQQI